MPVKNALFLISFTPGFHSLSRQQPAHLFTATKNAQKQLDKPDDEMEEEGNLIFKSL